MSHTTNYEHLLEKSNVIGVEYDEETDQVTAFVTEKVPEDDLDEADVVANDVDVDSDVYECGELTPNTHPDPQEVPEAKADRRDRHRPVVGGISEMNVNGTAATGGPFRAVVLDPEQGTWDTDVEAGDEVRLSNNHVYARGNQANLGEPITQPSPHDGGTIADEVGKLVGYVPLADGVTVDVAARSSLEDVRDSPAYHQLDSTHGQEIYRGDWTGKGDDTLVKTGRTTGVSRGTVVATSASVKVRYRKIGMVTLRDQVMVTDISDGGDSGSPVFDDETGELVALNFAGSPKVSVLNKVPNIEDALGVELKPREEDDEPRDGMQYVRSLKTTVSIEMAKHDLDIEQINGKKPDGGETVQVDVDVSGNYGGDVWLDVQGERYEASLGDEEHTHRFAVDVTAPSEYQEEFDLTIEGGYVLE